MLALIDAFMKIALRRLGPEHLPDSGFLLLLVTAAYVLMQTVLAVPVYGVGPALVRSVGLDVLLLCGVVWGLLKLTGHPRRFRQTLTALFGTGALLAVFILPFNYWLQAAGSPGQPPLAPTLGILAVISWSLVVNGHILARALSAPFVIGMMASVTWFLLTYLVFWQLGPAPA